MRQVQWSVSACPAGWSTRFGEGLKGLNDLSGLSVRCERWLRLKLIPFGQTINSFTPGVESRDRQAKKERGHQVGGDGNGVKSGRGK